MNEFSIEHDGRFSLSLTCSERYHGHHEQVSNKEPRSLPQNVPPGDTSLAAQSKERESCIRRLLLRYMHSPDNSLAIFDSISFTHE